MIFFCKGALETIRRMDWPPDIIHCHGWMTSLVPLYLKTAYKGDPVFKSTKVVYSVYKNSFSETLSKEFMSKALVDDSISAKELKVFEKLDNDALTEGGLAYSDGVVIGSPGMETSLNGALKKLGKPVLQHLHGEDYLSAYQHFYEELAS